MSDESEAAHGTDFLAKGFRVGQIIDASEMPQFAVASSGAVRGKNAPALRLRVTAVTKDTIDVEEVKADVR